MKALEEPLVPSLSIESVTKDYGSLRAVNEVSFELGEGEIFGLLGPNGAGKTSLISVIVTLEQPTSGDVRVFGHSVLKEPRIAKSKVGFVPQELINHGFFNVEEIMRFHSGYYGLRQNKERIDYLLHRMDLYDHRKKKVKQLSGGMKRRLLIAKALVHSPRLLLLDEPTAGVDIELRNSLWEFVLDLKKEGVSVLLTTHYLEEAEQLCDRVGILQKGHLKRVGDTKDLIKEMTMREIVFRFKGQVPQINHSKLISQSDHELVFKVPSHLGVGEVISELPLEWSQVDDIKIQEGSLEEAFKEVLGGGKNEVGG